MSKPIIGITTRRIGRDYQSYADAVEAAGGVHHPLLVRPGGIEAAEEDMKGIHGLILSGGSDIHPDNYDSRNEPGDELLSTEELLKEYNMTCHPDRDEYEIPIAHLAYDSKMPILGICRGFQMLNVILGGSLIKDIRTGLKHWPYRKHESREGNPGDSRSHLTTTNGESGFAGILGDYPLLVNTRHHQGVSEREKSPKLRAVAFAPDGIIEAVEALEHPWAFAVQWHPERQSDVYIYEPCKALFLAFLRECRLRMT